MMYVVAVQVNKKQSRGHCDFSVHSPNRFRPLEVNEINLEYGVENDVQRIRLR